MEQRKLLLADDSITIQKVINLTFADEGIEVTAFGNGATAIEQLEEVKPDLVLADVHMPGLSGYEVCEKIRRTPGFEHIPVMLLVGSFEPFDETEARRVGANDFLTKPFQSIKQLVSKVHLLLENSASETQNVEQEAPETQEFTRAAQTPTAFENSSPFNFQQSQQNESKYNFGDSTFDDEMIETSSGGNFDNTLRDYDVTSDEQETENEWQVIEQTPSLESAVQSESSTDLQYLETEQENNFTDFEPYMHNAPTVELDSNLLNIQTEHNPAEAEKHSNATEEELFTFGETVNSDEFEIEVEAVEALDETSVAAPELETRAPQTAVFESDFESTNDFDLKADTKESAAPQPLADAPQSPFAELFDDDDLLGIEEEIRAEAAEQAKQTAANETDTNNAEAISPEIVTESENESEFRQLAPINQQSGMQKAGEMTFNFPPEVIDAIAARVVEKLSDKVIEKIAWEIVPDRFDLIVRKTIQDKDRDR